MPDALGAEPTAGAVHRRGSPARGAARHRSPAAIRHRLPLALCAALLSRYAAAGTKQRPAGAQIGPVLIEARQPPVLGLQSRAPVKVLTATALHDLGVQNLGQALRLMPLFGSSNGLGTGRTSKFTNGGEQSADLFDLTNSRVVILVNGQRWIEGFQGDTDLSTFPVALIQKIEVYPARGAVAYGDGAIAGVVNIITVPSFTGVMASAGTGISHGSGHWDGQRTWASLALGRRGKSSGLMALLSWSNQSGVSSAARALTAAPLAGSGTTRESPITPYGQFTFVPTGGPYANSNLCPLQSNGSRLCNFTASPIAGGGVVPLATATAFNTLPYNDLIMPLKQWGFYVSGFHVLGGGVRADATLFVGRRTARQSGAPSTITLGTSGLPISVSANQPYNPFGVALEASGPNANLIALSQRLTGLGPVVFRDRSDTYRATVSLTGSLGRGARSSWRWHMDYLWSASRVNDQNQGRVNLNNLALALGNPRVCASVPQCTPLNLFAGPDGETPAMLAFIGLPEQNQIANSLQTLDVRLAQHQLLKLPAGALALGLGYQYLARHGDFTPDPAASQGIDSAVPMLQVPAYIGGYTGNALWAQSIVPIIGGVHALTLGAGLRVYRYSDTGTGHVAETTLSYDVRTDLTLQAGWTQGLRTPDLRELGQSMPGAAATVSDPCSNYGAPSVATVVAAACAAAGVPASYIQTNNQVQNLKIGNSVLQAERSENAWLSARWTPRSVPALSLNVAYYRIQINNAITRLSAQQTLIDCYDLGYAPTCVGIDRAADGQLTVISTQATNGQSIFTDWLTGGFRYVWRTALGRFSARSDIAWTHHYIVTTVTTAGVQVQELAGVELGSGSPSGIPTWNGTAMLEWTRGPWDVGWQIAAIGPMSEACTNGYEGTPYSYTALGLCSAPNLTDPSRSLNHLGTTLYHDVYLNYRFSRRLTVTAGVDNLFGKAPPVSVTQPSNYDPSIYRAPGRTVYAGMNYGIE